MAKVKLTVYVPEDLKEKAKRKAEAEDTSLSRKIRQSLRRWVNEDPQKKKD